MSEESVCHAYTRDTQGVQLPSNAPPPTFIVPQWMGITPITPIDLKRRLPSSAILFFHHGDKVGGKSAVFIASTITAHRIQLAAQPHISFDFLNSRHQYLQDKEKLLGKMTLYLTSQDFTK